MQYKNNPIYQDITPEEEYRDNSRDNRIYIDMRRSQGYTDQWEKLTRDDRKKEKKKDGTKENEASN